MFDTYVEFRSTGGINMSAHPLGQFRLAAAVVDAIHFENARRAREGLAKLAVGFPDLVEAGRDVMARIRVFGQQADADNLNGLAAKVTSDDRSRGFIATPARPVPERHDFVGYARDRSADREFNGYSERALARAQRKVVERLARGEEVRKPPMDSVNRGERLAERQIESSFVTRAHLRLRSRSNGQNFALFVTPVPSPNGSPEAKLDIYGLSARAAAVPVPNF